MTGAETQEFDDLERPSQDDPSAEIVRLQAELRETADRLLRAKAEIDNVSKRARRELDDALRYANLPLLRELLPVVDNIQRAVQATQNGSERSSLLSGVKMVAQSLDELLARWHCKRIEALHKPFDPAFHEAIAQQPNDDFPPQTVLLVVLEGYTLHDRVVRAAQVIVSTNPPESG